MKLRALAAATLGLVLATQPAAAQPGAPLAPPAPPPPASSAGDKSEGVGVGLGIAGTILPAIAFGIGLSIDDRDTRSDVVIGSLLGGVVLPASGLIYAKRKGKAVGMVPRVGAVLVLGGAALFDALDEEQEANKWYTVSALLYVVGAGIDIAMTPSAVRSYNARQRGLQATLAPTAVPGGAGLAVVGQF